MKPKYVNEITRVLVKRDGLNPFEASNLYEEALTELKANLENEDAGVFWFEDFCQDWFGLEPDYIFTLMGDAGY